MVNGVTWEEQALARLKEARAKQKEAKADFDYWTEYTHALETVLELERQKRALSVGSEHSVDPESLRRKSIREALIEIAGGNNGLLVVRDAVGILIRANVSQDRDQIRNAIYSTLHQDARQDKGYFEKERKGIYRLTNRGQVQLSLVS